MPNDTTDAADLNIGQALADLHTSLQEVERILYEIEAALCVRGLFSNEEAGE